MDEITDRQKEIYNVFLRVVAEVADRPFKHRKNFSTLKNDVCLSLAKLEGFFEKYPHIDVYEYLMAPYKVWDDVKFQPLDFYIKRKSLIVYQTYKKSLVDLEPDSDYHMGKLVESFKFIFDFCKNNNIKPDDYIHVKNGVNVCLTHLKEGRVSLYSLFVFKGFKRLFVDLDRETKKLLFGNYYSDIEYKYRKYLASSKFRKSTEKALHGIKNHLK